MKNFGYFNPVDVKFGNEVIRLDAGYYKGRWKRALIVTGKHSAVKSGAMADIKFVLGNAGIEYIIFDEIQENPEVSSVIRCRDSSLIFKPQVIIGIGGGSPLDAAKGVAVALSSDCSADELFDKPFDCLLPVICIPTTAGTGSEVTPFAILTHNGVKKSIPSKVYPTKAYIDPEYLKTLSNRVFTHTIIDTLSHLIEGYLTGKGSVITDSIAQTGLSIISRVLNVLHDGVTGDLMIDAATASFLGGLVISQSGTSIPHLLGYQLTVNHAVAHGAATSIFIEKFLTIYKDKNRVDKIISLLNLKNVAELGTLIRKLLSKTETLVKPLTDMQIESYAVKSFDILIKSGRYPFDIELEDIRDFYRGVGISE